MELLLRDALDTLMFKYPPALASSYFRMLNQERTE